jgi:L-lactate dehydrogenase complex protein LldG
MLTRIARSLGRGPSTIAPPSLPPFSLPRAGVSHEALVERFVSEVSRVGGFVARIGTVVEMVDYLLRLLTETGDGRVAISDALAKQEPKLGQWLQEQRARVIPCAVAPDRHALLSAEIGVTFADFAIADTGTLVLVSGAEKHRLISLVPPIHVCLLDPDRIVANLTELLKQTGEQHYSRELAPCAMTFITGPSRTADIEHTVTTGVHGPRELHILLYSGRKNNDAS